MELIELGIKYGLPTVLLFVLLWMLREGAKWFGKEFVVPLRERITRFFDNMDSWMRHQTRLLMELRDGYIDHHAAENQRLDDQDRKLDRIEMSVTKRWPNEGNNV